MDGEGATGPSAALPDASIGSIRVAGVDAGIALQLGPAIEAGLQAAWRDGRLAPGARPDVRIRVPHGATADDIVRALIAQLTR
jgi:hypothetical protein